MFVKFMIGIDFHRSILWPDGAQRHRMWIEFKLVRPIWSIVQSVSTKQLIEGRRVGSITEGKFTHLAHDSGDNLRGEAPFDDTLNGDAHFGVGIGWNKAIETQWLFKMRLVV